MSTKRTTAFAFHNWMTKHGWTLHSSNEFWFRITHPNQWPPEESLTEDLLWKKFKKDIYKSSYQNITTKGFL